jgi:cobalamin biosynthesis protein CobD/CbiB
MFGLVALEHTVHPANTIEKLVFLIENAFTHYNRTTTTISFGALLVLVCLRASKTMFQKYWWIYRLPEVLVVVVVSTCMCLLLYDFSNTSLTPVYSPVLSRELQWDKHGVDIVGSIAVNTGGSFIQSPLRHSTFKYLRRTTSTAA